MKFQKNLLQNAQKKNSCAAKVPSSLQALEQGTAFNECDNMTPLIMSSLGS